MSIHQSARTLAIWLLASAPLAMSAERLRVSIKEPAGIQRRSFPVHGRLKLPRAVSARTNFRLLLNDKPLTAQFRPQRSDAATDSWWLDFATSLGPNEQRQYVVEYGPDVAAGPERKSGHQLFRRNGDYVVSNKPYIDWVVPADLAGFLRAVNFRPNKHLAPDSAGLLMRDRNGKLHPMGGKGTAATVVRQGRMTVALRFQGTETAAALAGVRWTVDLVFPGPVSWVEYQLHIQDPRDRVAEIGLKLNLNLAQSTSRTPTIVDLGGPRTVYARLRPADQIELRGDASGKQPAWSVFRGSGDALQPFVVPRKTSLRAEGWAHVMDRSQCLAIAFARFGQDGPERIRLQGDGRFQAWKRFAGRQNNSKHWRSWLHFVHFPPQASATADPQQMQTPIEFRQGQ